MSSNNLVSVPNDRTPSNPSVISTLTPFKCLVRFRTAAQCNDLKQIESLRNIWDNFSDEEKAPYRTVAFSTFVMYDLMPRQVARREVSPEITKNCEPDTDEKSIQERLNDSDSRGSSLTSVGDDHTSSQPSSQESSPTPPDQDEISYIRSFGPWDNTDYIALAPEDDQQEAPNGGTNAQRYIWIYDPDTLKRLQSR